MEAAEEEENKRIFAYSSFCLHFLFYGSTCMIPGAGSYRHKDNQLTDTREYR
jgi:hypothetical protein